MALLAVLPVATVLDASSASAVSSHVPKVVSGGSFLFGHAPVRPEQTRRVVDTRSGAEPLSLLFWVARGGVASPSTVVNPPASAVAAAPVVAPAPASAPRAPTPAPAAAPFNGVLPPMGKAWAWGCPAAIQYLLAYSAPGFNIECGAYDGGHEATTTCISGASLCDEGRSIVISDPCPAAYMNEASNSWVLIGVWQLPIDPYGKCP